MRTKSIDALKVLCAFLIVCIHIPFEIRGSGYYIALTRIGVPIFLMISGYFYRTDRGFRQIKKIAFLFVEANLLYFVWKYIYCFFGGTFPKINNISLIKLIVLNESPFSSHLWYIGAIGYTLIVVSFLDKHGMINILYRITPFLLLADLVLGKYSLFIFDREFPYIIVRNWLFVGIPFFTIGMFMRKNSKFRIGLWGIPIFMVTTVLERWILVTNGLNTTRDQYISTIFLSVAVFSYALKYKGEVNAVISKIGKDYSTWIYIIHPIFHHMFR